MGISIRAYARHRGVSAAAVHKAVKSGRIKTEQDGTIDVAKADRQWQANTDPSKQRVTPQAPALQPKPASNKEDVAGMRSVRQTLRESGQSTSGMSTFEQAKTAHEIAKAHLARLQLQEKRGELINKAKTTAQIFRLAREIRDAWLNWPSRISAQLAADLGVDEHKMHTSLERYVRDHLTELGDVKPPKFD